MILKPRFYGAPAGCSLHALDFDGAGEYMKTAANATYGIADVWTLEGWIKPNSISIINEAVFVLRAKDPLANDSRLRIFQQNANIEVELTDQSGLTVFKDLQWNIFTANTWIHIVITYDGAAAGDPVVLYKNAVDQGAGTGTNNTGTMADTNKKLQLGNDDGLGFNLFAGRMFEWAMWNSVLSASEVATIYNSGNGGFDLSTNSGNYASSANLKHWWKLGFDVPNIGHDFVSSGGRDLTAGSGIDSSDLVNDGPGCS